MTDFITIRTPVGQLDVRLSDIVCFGRVSDLSPETLWLRTGLSVEVADGTCREIREALCNRHQVQVPPR